MEIKRFISSRETLKVIGDIFWEGKKEKAQSHDDEWWRRERIAFIYGSEMRKEKTPVENITENPDRASADVVADIS